MQEILLSVDNEDINQVISYLLNNSGKMLRPRLVCLTASLYPHDGSIVRDIAAAVEMIHMASLVHDDIIDEALIRRGRESINGKWGNHIGVLTGDYLFASAFKLINYHGLLKIMDNITETIQIMCSGEIHQMTMAYNTDISEDDYYDKSYRKTACLFASSCKTGALLSSMPLNEIEVVEQFGSCLGYAYQIIDDLLDFVSDSTLIGKPVGNDLVQGNITLPVIFALQSEYGPWLKTVIRNRNLADQEIKKIISILEDCGAIQYSLDRSREFLNQGLNLIHILPDHPARRALEELAVFLVEGYYNKLQHYGVTSGQEAVR
ncbi:MAG: polyprenyl synthetase family protein [Syntrophomonadaceae bacterium]|jgi:heptaprenyl diphosphate synthase